MIQIADRETRSLKRIPMRSVVLIAAVLMLAVPLMAVTVSEDSDADNVYSVGDRFDIRVISDPCVGVKSGSILIQYNKDVIELVSPSDINWNLEAMLKDFDESKGTGVFAFEDPTSIPSGKELISFRFVCKSAGDATVNVSISFKAGDRVLYTNQYSVRATVIGSYEPDPEPDPNANKVETHTEIIHNTDGSTVEKTVEIRYDSNGVKMMTTTTETTTYADGSSVEKTSSTSRGVTSERTVSRDSSGNTTGIEERSVSEKGIEARGNYEKIESTVTMDGSGNVLSETDVTTTVTIKNGSTIRSVESTVKGPDGKESGSVEVHITSTDGSVTTDYSETTNSVRSEASMATKVSVTTGQGGGQAKVYESLVTEALQQMAMVDVNPSADIHRSLELSVNGTDIVLSSGSFRAIGESKIDLRFTGSHGSILFPSVVSSRFAGLSDDVSLSLKKADVNSMNPLQRAAVRGYQVFQIGAFIGSEAIHELGDRVSVLLSYNPGPNEDTSHLTGYYIDDNGKLHSKETRYDPATRIASLFTDHFSYFMLGPEGLDEEGGSDNNSNVVLYAAIAGAVVLVAIIGYAFYRRN